MGNLPHRNPATSKRPKVSVSQGHSGKTLGALPWFESRGLGRTGLDLRQGCSMLPFDLPCSGEPVEETAVSGEEKGAERKQGEKGGADQREQG